MPSQFIRLIVCSFIAGFYSPALAEPLPTVAPDGFGNVDGSAISNGPIDDPGDRFQQIYGSNLFGNFGGSARLIKEIQFRAANPENTLRPNSIAASDVLITLSTTDRAANAAGIAGSFVSNIGSDVQTVFSGPITFDRGGSNPSGAQPFEYGFVLQNPFLYDPSRGNLLLDVSVPGSAVVSIGSGFGALESFDAVVDQPDIDGIASKVANFGAVSTGLVTQFTSVPEPASPFAIVLGTVAWRQRRHRR